MGAVSVDILGYIECNTCNDPKAIKQGKGKRSKFVHGRCPCGPDSRTGVAAQNELSAFKPLDVVKAAIAARLLPAEPNNVVPEPQSEPNNAGSEPQDKPNNTESSLQESLDDDNKPDALDIPKCVGLGSVIGLVFGLIIR